MSWLWLIPAFLGGLFVGSFLFLAALSYILRCADD
jgi:hypothetical protein